MTHEKKKRRKNKVCISRQPSIFKFKIIPEEIGKVEALLDGNETTLSTE